MPRVLFLADKFSDATRSDKEVHPGGAELTDEAAIAACPWPLTTARFSDFDPQRLSDFDLVVVGNSQSMSAPQIDALSAAGRHVLFEHDVRICRYNGNFPGKAVKAPIHGLFQRCTCPHRPLRSLFATARGVIHLTERQQRTYWENPFYVRGREAVLGASLFGASFLDRALRFHGERDRKPKSDVTAVVFSPNRIKGYAPSLRWADDQGYFLRELRNLHPNELLDALEGSERLVYLPIGLEPAGRLPVEARLLGCEVVVNAHVGVAGEAWWKDADRARALEFLSDAPRRFWRLVEDLSSHANPPKAVDERTPRRASALGRLARDLLLHPRRPLERRRQVERYSAW